jgi:tryptophan synthase alpha chain
MNRIEQLFQRKDKNVLNIYFTAGYPGLNDTEDIILSLEKAGVDLVEVGMPYSDPLADGPTIQESGTAALDNGMTLHLLFEQLAAVRKKTEMPLIMMGYFNQVMQYGEKAFFEKVAEVGVDGLILPDLPLFEYENHYKDLVESLGLAVSFLITPQTEPERIRKIDDLTHGFIYMVSSSSITGAKSEITDTQIAYFNRINDMQLKNKRLIGFGISNHETFETACKYANGAIIGSAYIKALKQHPNVAECTAEFVTGILRDRH